MGSAWRMGGPRWGGQSLGGSAKMGSAKEGGQPIGGSALKGFPSQGVSVPELCDGHMIDTWEL